MQQNDLLFRQAKSVPIIEVLNYYEIPICGHKINCLWHEDSTPSAHIYEETNVGYCFGCSRSQFDAIEIVMLKENIEFNEAIDFLLTNNFTVNNNFIFKQKKNLELYFKINDEIKQFIKDGEDVEMIKRQCQLIDMNNDKYKILLLIAGTIKRKVNYHELKQ
jgi:DNA primase